MAGVKCNDGYTLLGSVSRQCLLGGRWSGSTAKCTSKNINVFSVCKNRPYRSKYI